MACARPSNLKKDLTTKIDTLDIFQPGLATRQATPLGPIPVGSRSITARALLEGKVIHVADVLADPDYTFAEAQKLGDFRTILGVPVLREGILATRLGPPLVPYR
jgi:hypothetical protein